MTVRPMLDMGLTILSCPALSHSRTIQSHRNCGVGRWAERLDGHMGKYPEKALSGAGIRKLTEPGMYADGNCLYLIVEDSGSKHWIVRTTINGKRCDVGVGSLQYV